MTRPAAILSPGFFRLGNKEPSVKDRIRAIEERRLLKRCLEISRNTVVPFKTDSRVVDLRKLADAPEILRDLRGIIFDELPKSKQRSVHDLWLDIPRGPNIDKDAQQCFILNGGSQKARTLRDTFPIQEWLESYEVNKWKGHLFYTDEEDGKFRRAAAAVGARVLKKTFRVRFAEAAWTECKLPAPG